MKNIKILIWKDNQDPNVLKNSFNINYVLLKDSDDNYWNKFKELITINKDCSISIFIPTSFSNFNILSYDGAILALRIYLYLLRKGKGEYSFEIILLGTENQLSFVSHFKYPNIFKCPGIRYDLLKSSIISNWNSKPIKIPTDIALQKMETLNITIPSSFKSSHSFTNEWSLYIWNSCIGEKFNSSNLLNSLYFNYLITKNELSDSIKIKSFEINSDCKILLIDDHAEWESFFLKIINKEKTNKFKYIGSGFKHESSYEIIEEKIDSAIKEFDPDIILLDFRLIEDSDHKSSIKIEDISGTKILKHLKGSPESPGDSFGRQVIIFSATRQIENYTKLAELNADGFILKEKPEEYIGKKASSEHIQTIVDSITKASIRASFLKPLNNKLIDIENFSYLFNGLNPNNEEEINNQEKIKTIIKTIRFITQKRSIKNDYLAILRLTYLTMFGLIELIKDDKNFVNCPNANSLSIKFKSHNINIAKKKSRWGCSINEYQGGMYKILYNEESKYSKYIKDKDLNFIISSFVIFKLGVSKIDDEYIWTRLRILRNAIAHSKDKIWENKYKTPINHEMLCKYCIELADFIISLYDPMQINDCNIDKCLT